MTDGVGVNVDVTELRTTLKRVAPELEKEFRREFKKIGIDARNRIKSGAPVRTGRLQRGIGVRTQFTQTKTRVKVVGNTSEGRTYYWLQEHGTRYARAHPYINPAVSRVIQTASPELERLVKRVLNK